MNSLIVKRRHGGYVNKKPVKPHLKRGGDVREVCNASADDQNFSWKGSVQKHNFRREKDHCEWTQNGPPTVRVLLSGHQGQDSLGVVVGLLFTRCAGIFPVIGQLVDAAQVTDCVTKEEVYTGHPHTDHKAKPRAAFCLLC